MNYFVYQSCHNDCAITCVKILLAELSHNKSFLYIDNPQASDVSYSLLQVIEFAQSYGLVLKGFESENKSLTSSSISFPCIINLKLDSSKLHSVVIKKIRKNKALVLDPEKGVQWKKISEIESIWDGKILLIESKNIETINIKQPRILGVKEEIFLCLIQFASLITCFVSMYFINESQKIFFPLIFFAVFIVLQILHHMYMVRCLKNFDTKYMESLFDTDKKRRKEKYQIMHKFKSVIFSTPSQLVTYLTTGVFLIVLLVLNINKMFYACLGLLLVSAIDGLFLDPSFQHQKDDLDSNEFLILNSDFEETIFAQRLKEQSENAYSFSSKIFLKKTVFIMLVLFADLIVLILDSKLSLSNVLFYFFLLYFLFENLDGAMIFFNKFNLMNRLKRRFVFYFKERI